MLSGLRPGIPVFVLNKNELVFKCAKVVSVSNQYPQYNFQQPLNPGNGPVVDLTVEIDGKTETFTKIPMNSSIAEFPDKGIIISETREGIVNEINVIMGNSQTALEQEPTHRKIIESCKALLVEVNPQLRREQEQADEIASLKRQLSEMSGRFDSVNDQLAALTGMLSKSLSKKPKED